MDRVKDKLVIIVRAGSEGRMLLNLLKRGALQGVEVRTESKDHREFSGNDGQRLGKMLDAMGVPEEEITMKNTIGVTFINPRERLMGSDNRRKDIAVPEQMEPEDPLERFVHPGDKRPGQFRGLGGNIRSPRRRR